MKHPIEAIIFDLDGTLLDTIKDIANCANTVLDHWECPTHSVETYTELLGDGLTNLARKALPASRRTMEDIEAFVKEYRSLYQARWNETSTAYAGVVELLGELCRREIPLAVLSNKRDDFTQVCVSHFFPSIPFRDVRGERSGVPIKPDPQAALDIARSLDVEPARCLFVGDSEIDVKTGLHAGMTSVGVLWGFRSQAILEEAGANILISHPRELTALVDGEFRQHESARRLFQTN
jgi:phosphoglycolate phosphatase